MAPQTLKGPEGRSNRTGGAEQLSSPARTPNSSRSQTAGVKGEDSRVSTQPLRGRLGGITNLLVQWGHEVHTFSVHTEHLKQESPTLRRLLSATDAVDVKYTAKPNLFAIWMTWTYYQHLEYDRKEADPFNILVDMYMLGWKLATPTFMNEVVKEMCRESATTGQVMDVAAINRVYELTPKTLPLRRLVVEHWISGLKADDFSWAEEGKLSHEFLFDCTKRLMSMKPKTINNPDDKPELFYVSLDRLPSTPGSKAPIILD